MKTELLQYCVDIAESQNFTKAAEKNHMTQQAMSQLVKKLEEELGFQIFDRNNRSVSLTQAGEIFVFQADLILRQLDSAIRSAKVCAAGGRGSLTIGYNGPLSQRCLSRVLGVFHERFSNIEINLVYESNQKLLADFTQGRFDLIVTGDFAEFDPGQYDMVRIKSGEICAVFGKNHPLAGVKSVTADELLRETYVSLDFRDDPGMYARSMNRCRQVLGRVPEKIKYARNTESVDIIVAGGIGYTFLSTRLAEFYKTALLSYVPIQDTHVVHSSRFVWDRANGNPVLKRFVDTVKCVDMVE